MKGTTKVAFKGNRIEARNLIFKNTNLFPNGLSLGKGAESSTQIICASWQSLRERLVVQNLLSQLGWAFSLQEDKLWRKVKKLQ